VRAGITGGVRQLLRRTGLRVRLAVEVTPLPVQEAVHLRLTPALALARSLFTIRTYCHTCRTTQPPISSIINRFILAP